MFGFEVRFGNNGNVDAVIIKIGCQHFDGVRHGQRRRVQ